MLEKLRAKGIYSQTFCCVLGDKFKKIHQDISDESYDIVIIMGGFAQSHLPIDSLYQAARALKPGNYQFYVIMNYKQTWTLGPDHVLSFLIYNEHLGLSFTTSLNLKVAI